LTLAFFSAAALWCLWGPRRHDWLSLRGAVFIVLAFFVPLFPATLFPTVSVYATAGLAARGGMPPNLIFAGVAIGLALAGYGLAQRDDRARQRIPAAVGGESGRGEDPI